MTDSVEHQSRKRWILAARWLMTIALFAGLIAWLDLDRLIDELSRFSMAAVLVALGVSVLQVIVSAWRWRFTARCLGLSLPFATAIREYYLAMFLNQLLPGGVLGDVNRAWRHGRGSGDGQLSLHAVMIERLSGQVVMALIAVIACVWLAVSYPGIQGWLAALVDSWLGVAAIVAAGLALIWLALERAGPAIRHYVKTLGSDIKRGLLDARVLPVQLGSSVLVAGTYLGVFLLLATSAQDNLSALQVVTLLALCSLLLLAMVIPLTVAGWGVREGAAAILWPLAGLPAEQGVALSVGYGLTVLLSSLPGGLFVFSRPASG